MQHSFAIIFCTCLLLACAGGSRVKARPHSNKKAAAQMRSDDPPMMMSPSTTVSGCTCKANSKCGATVNASLWQCDWCRTDEGCGRFGVGGRWDYCQYPKMVDYESQTASQKTEQLWNNIIADDVVGKSGSTKSLLGVLKTMVGESMRTPFDTHWDVLPEGRTKVIHSQGVHCKFELDVAQDSPFTGLFAPGKVDGIIRIGSASSNDASGNPPFPGLSFKFLRSKVHSANFVALRASGTSLPKGSSGNGYAFFDEHFSKIVNPPAALQALMKFETASSCPSMIGLSDVCSWSQDGTQTPDESLKFPYDIQFEASSTDVYLPDEKMTDEEMLGHLSSIEAGTQLFNVFAMASPTEGRAPLGTLKITSKCEKSVFGDTALFFRHQRMEEDFVREPSWVTSTTAAGCKPKNADSSEWQCPGVV